MRRALTLALVLAGSCLLAQAPGRAGASDDEDGHPLFIREGVGVGDIEVGESTMGDVVARYGQGYALIRHGAYSYEIRYPDPGLSFYYKYEDTSKKIFCVNVRRPARGFTNRGIVIGESTLEDVLRLYGKSELYTTTAEETYFLSYPGIDFHVEYGPKREPDAETFKRKVIEVDVEAPETAPDEDADEGAPPAP